MALTFLVDDKRQTVGIVRWYREPNYNLCHPDGPLIEFTFEQFRKAGAEFVRDHFNRYNTYRVREEDCVHPLPEPELKKYLKGTLPIEIMPNGFTGQFSIVPLRFKRYTLGDVEEIDKEFRRNLATTFTDSEFWQEFDAALETLR